MSMELVLFLLILYIIVRRIILLNKRNAPRDVPRDRPAGPWPYEEPDFDWQDSVMVEEDAPVAHAPVPRKIKLSRPDHLQSGNDEAIAEVAVASYGETRQEGYARHERQAAQEQLAAGHTRPFTGRILPAELANGFIWSQILDQRGGRQAQRRRHN